MLAFIIPIKSSKISHNWALTSQLFERCLRAICSQTSTKFRVVVVCNERPQTQFSHANVSFVEVDYPPPIADPTEEATSGYELSRSNDIARKNADKARKIQAGLDYAQRFQPTHSMVVDADDCVSNRLAEFVEKNPQGAGWYLKKGFLYTEGSRFLYLNRQNFNVVCGSSVIIAFRDRDRLFSGADFYQHAFYVPPTGLVPLPFVGAVYSMANGDNIYMSSHTRDHIYASIIGRLFSKQIFSVAWKILRYWPTLLTRSKRGEFGLYKIGEQWRSALPSARQALESTVS